MSRNDTDKDELEAIREAAHSWRVLLDDELASDLDQNAFQYWLTEDPRHREEFERIETLWGRLGAVTEDALVPENRASLDRARVTPTKETIAKAEVEVPTLVSRWCERAWFPRAAGAIAVAAATAFIFLPLPDVLNRKPEIVSSAVTAYSTALGEVEEIALPDGSVATLGADSVIEFAMSPTKRDVTLARGEAFFAVASDAGRPFTVRGGDLLVEVTGTAFGVRLGVTQADVAVSEGHVKVSYPIVVGGEPRPSMRTQLQISAGSAVTATRERGLRPPTSIQQDAVAAWREGRLVYVATPLFEVVADANRYSATPIVIVEDSVSGITVSGSFDAGEIAGTLDTLAEMLPIRIDRSTPDRVQIIGTTD